MGIILIQEMCKKAQTPEMVKRYSDAGIGLVLILSVQLLVIPTQIALDLHHINLPASILVMVSAAMTMIVVGSISVEVAQYYERYLRGPTDLIGRHMSFGFVAFFILLIRDHISKASHIPRLAGVFGKYRSRRDQHQMFVNLPIYLVVTTIMSYVASFLLAGGLSRLEKRFRFPQQTADDLESNTRRTWPSPSIAWPAPSAERHPILIARLSTLSEVLSTKDVLMQIHLEPESLTSSFVDFVLRTAPIWICLFLLIVVGLPVGLATDYMLLFDVFMFTLFWVLSVQFQRSLRASSTLLRWKHPRTFLLVFANPLLLTWALGTAYMFAKSSCTGRDINIIVGEFRHNSSLAQSIKYIMDDQNNVSAHLGAGDLASLVLDAGVACMGFKMYEYRSELWASLGTVSLTCLSLAALNVFLNVLVARSFGLETTEALAFASRSTTLALGVPAMENLSGSTALMSTVTIFSGILFQMSGDWLFSLMGINDRTAPQDGPSQALSVPVQANTYTPLVPVAAADDTKKKRATSGSGKPDEDSTVVAAGVTAGINAAAMGTAYLISRDSRATAYSALSMIMFGAATVALTALPGAAKITMALASG